MGVSAKEKISYGLGGLGKNLAFTLVSSYTLYYYNSVLHVSASFVAILLMAARIFDAFNDPVMGLVVAKTNSKYGKYKPWIFTGALLNALVVIAMFSVPEGLGGGGIKLYISITYILCGITYTLSDIPYWAIIPAVTSPGKDRESMSVFARMFAGIGSGLVTAFTMTLVAKLGGGYDRNSYRQGFSLLAIVIAVVYIVTTTLTCIYLPKESNKEPEKTSVKEIFGALIRNDQALVLSLVIILFYSATTITINSAIYVFDYDLANPRKYTSFMVLVGLVQFFAMAILYPMLRKITSNRNIFLTGCVLGLAGYAVLIMEIPLDEIPYMMLVIPSILVGLSNGIAYVLVTVFVANAVDYGEKKTGKRENSMVSSLQTLMVKLSSAFAVFVVGIGLDWAGFSEEETQFRESIIRLRVLFSVPSLILMLCATLLFFYRKDMGTTSE